jgi:hypothetical protein
MYAFVEDKAALGAAKSFGNELMMKLASKLEKKGIEATFFLIGSGARNLVTQNGNKPFDLDYNLKIISSSIALNDLKDEIRSSFNEVLSFYELPDCSDSTSSLSTGYIFGSNRPDAKFSIDVGIISQNKNGKLQRLIHDKKVSWDRFLWVIALNSEAIDEKAAEIKSAGCWDEVRQDYLQRKNRYLTNNDHEHPSFICYIETINDIYNWMKQESE